MIPSIRFIYVLHTITFCLLSADVDAGVRLEKSPIQQNGQDVQAILSTPPPSPACYSLCLCNCEGRGFDNQYEVSHQGSCDSLNPQKIIPEPQDPKAPKFSLTACWSGTDFFERGTYYGCYQIQPSEWQRWWAEFFGRPYC